MNTVSINVLGTPAPKGSSRAILIRGRAVNVPGGSNANRTKLKGWDASVRERALEVIGVRDSPVFVGRLLCVELQFRLQRPSGHWKTDGMRLKPSAPVAPGTKPDIDKLARATLDSLTGLAFDDDSRIVRLIASKVYAGPGQEGAYIAIHEYTHDVVVTFSQRADEVDAA